MRGTRRYAVLAFFLAFSQATAQAQDAEVARAHFEAGTRAFETGAYEQAVAEFERAYAITQHPDILFNIYSAAERAGSLETAESALTRYLAQGSPSAEERPALEQRLERLRERIAARAQGLPEEQEEEPRETEPETESEPPPPSGVHPAGIATLITAGVIGLAFGGLAIASQVQYDALRDECGDAGMCSDEQLDGQRALNIAVDVTWITAAVALVVGVVLLVALPPESSAPESSAYIAPWFSPEGGGLAISGRF